MLTVADAYGRVMERSAPLPPVAVSLENAQGLVLAEAIASDVDSPPFDKALVDGFAVRSADLATAEEVDLAIVAEILAGGWPSREIGPGEAAAIMTGAPLPPGADAVVMIEQALRHDPATVRLRGPVKSGQHRMLRGREMSSGEVVLEAGVVLNAARIGLLGTVGRAQVPVIRPPVVVVVATGDELVAVDQVPGPGQIRNSNAAMLAAMARSFGATVRIAPIAPDDHDGLRAVLQAARPADVLIVGGGVSMGAKDLVPAALESLGIAPVFHKVRVKPGKPLWFGVGPGGSPLAFGLPGNPVSGLVGMLLFVGPAIRALRGEAVDREAPEFATARLATPFEQRGDRPSFHPARIVGREGGLPVVEPIAWAGSPDLRAVAGSDGFAAFEAGDRSLPAGEIVGFLPLRG